MIRPATKLLYDFSLPYCHPGKTITLGALAPGSKFLGLTKNAVEAVVGGTVGTQFSVVSGGGVSVPVAATVAAGNIAIGGAGAFNMAPAPYEFAIILWMKVPAASVLSGSKSPLYLGSGGTGSSQVYFDFGSDGTILRGGVVDAGGALKAVAAAGVISRDVPVQIGLHFDPGVRLALYINGAVVSELLAGVPTTLFDASTYFMRLSSVALWTYYRVSLTNIDASKAAEAAQGFDASTILSAHDYIVRDYQFCTNAIAAAPKTAFT
jgi:hypothetical protein